MATFCKYVSSTDLTPIWPEGVPFPAEIVNGEVRFQFETRGPWSILTELTGIAVEKQEHGVLVHGRRKLQNPKESGYNHGGRVNVGGGVKRPAFTSSQLFLVEGKLVDVGILYVCRPKKKED